MDAMTKAVPTPCPDPIQSAGGRFPMGTLKPQISQMGKN